MSEYIPQHSSMYNDVNKINEPFLCFWFGSDVWNLYRIYIIINDIFRYLTIIDINVRSSERKWLLIGILRMHAYDR